MYYSYESPFWGDITALTEHLHNGQNVKFIEIQVVRSLNGFPFAPKMTVAHYETTEKLVKEALKKLEPTLSGLYLTLNSTNWSEDMVNQLQHDRILFDHETIIHEKPQRYVNMFPFGAFIICQLKKTEIKPTFPAY